MIKNQIKYNAIQHYLISNLTISYFNHPPSEFVGCECANLIVFEQKYKIDRNDLT